MQIVEDAILRLNYKSKIYGNRPAPTYGDFDQRAIVAITANTVHFMDTFFLRIFKRIKEYLLHVLLTVHDSFECFLGPLFSSRRVKSAIDVGVNPKDFLNFEKISEEFICDHLLNKVYRNFSQGLLIFKHQFNQNF